MYAMKTFRAEEEYSILNPVQNVENDKELPDY
jgi:hypothetical protein